MYKGTHADGARSLPARPAITRPPWDCAAAGCRFRRRIAFERRRGAAVAFQRRLSGRVLIPLSCRRVLCMRNADHTAGDVVAVFLTVWSLLVSMSRSGIISMGAEQYCAHFHMRFTMLLDNILPVRASFWLSPIAYRASN